MVGNLSSIDVTIKTLIGGNLKNHKTTMMKTRCQKVWGIGRHADKSGPRLTVRNQALVKIYAAGTTSSPEHPNGSQNRENLNLGLWDSSLPGKKPKPKGENCTRE